MSTIILPRAPVSLLNFTAMYTWNRIDCPIKNQMNGKIKKTKNIRQGYHLNSRYWQKYKASLPCLPDRLFDIAVGMILGDASWSKVSREAHIKFEQGYKQEAFLYHLFHQFHLYSFMEEPGKRVDLRGKRLGCIKSFWAAPQKNQFFYLGAVLIAFRIARLQNYGDCFTTQLQSEKAFQTALCLII